MMAAKRATATKRKQGLVSAINRTDLQCHLCSRTPFKSESGLRYHLQTAHGVGGSGKSGAACPDCGYQSSPAGVALHRSLSHRKDKKKTHHTYACPYCEFTTTNKARFDTHKQKMHPEKTGIEIMGRTANRIQESEEHIVQSTMLDKVLAIVADKIYKQVIEGVV